MTICSISPRGVLILLNLSDLLNKFVKEHGKEGRSEKTSRNGTSKAGLILSFMNFTEKRRNC